MELRTATGEAIPIFGQKNMHLVTQNLCFEVSFVIANVTTPILGVDTLLRENLSLRFQGSQQQTCSSIRRVHPALSRGAASLS